VPRPRFVAIAIKRFEIMLDQWMNNGTVEEKDVSLKHIGNLGDEPICY
jgi:hypothetical protein